MAEPTPSVQEEGRPKFTGQMHVLNEEGDTKITWDKDDPISVGAAKAAYEDAKKRGYYAYKVTGKGGRGERIMTREFDPNEEMVILAPQIIGG